MTKVATPPDPWQRVVTEGGFAADEVISALQKSLRRGLLDDALLLGFEMYRTSEELEEKLWARLQVISVEDVGFGRIEAPVIVDALYRMHLRLPRPTGDRFLFAAHAIRLIATSPKERSTDDMVNWAMRGTALGELSPEIIDAALDMHTGRGQAMGRDYHHFMSEASKVAPPSEAGDLKYREWIVAALADGRLT